MCRLLRGFAKHQEKLTKHTPKDFLTRKKSCLEKEKPAEQQRLSEVEREKKKEAERLERSRLNLCEREKELVESEEKKEYKLYENCQWQTFYRQQALCMTWSRDLVDPKKTVVAQIPEMKRAC